MNNLTTLQKITAIKQYAKNFDIDYNTAIMILALQNPTEVYGNSDFDKAVSTLILWNKINVQSEEEYAKELA